MKFDRSTQILVGVIAVIVILHYGGLLGAVIGPYQDYIVYDDFNDGAKDSSLMSMQCSKCSVATQCSELEETGGTLLMHSTSKVGLTKNFYGTDVAIIGKEVFSCQNVGPHSGTDCEANPGSMFSVVGTSEDCHPGREFPYRPGRNGTPRSRHFGRDASS